MGGWRVSECVSSCVVTMITGDQSMMCRLALRVALLSQLCAFSMVSRVHAYHTVTCICVLPVLGCKRSWLRWGPLLPYPEEPGFTDRPVPLSQLAMPWWSPLLPWSRTPSK